MMEMETQPPPVSVSAGQKRPFEEDAPVSTPQKNNASTTDSADTPLTVLSSIATPSPLKQPVSNAPIPAPSFNSTPGVTASAPASSSDIQPAKRRKLTDKEKEEKRLEKEAKEKAKAELKAQREEEKRKKDEEKRKKNEEKEEKRRAKEQEQQQKEEEKLKKERSQMRLGAFFAKQKTDTNSSNAALVDSKQNIATNPLSSLSGTSTGDANIGSVSPQKAIKQSAKTDYERYFLPFQPPSYAIVAPYNLFMEDPKRKSEAASRLEQRIAREDASTEPVTMADIKAKIGPRRRGLDTPSIVEIVNRINDSSDNSVDLTQEGSTQDPLKLLKRVPMKYLHFPEDVRPPYYGTYTKAYTPREAAKLARNPFTRSLKEADYDYDSEAEWEEPEEGEDLNSDGEEDLDEDGDDDMDGFLDDEEDAQVKRRLISSDLEPISTGLCWEDPDRVSRLNDGSGAISTEFKDFRFGCLLESQPQSIDPFSTAYWAPPPTAPSQSTVSNKDGAISGMMQPPRLPLSQRPMNSMMNSLNTPSNYTYASGSGKSKPPRRLIPAEHLPEFKAEVEGSDLTKIALIEALKKKFPKFPKDAISNTLGAVAARVGAKEVDKRWVLLQDHP